AQLFLAAIERLGAPVGRLFALLQAPIASPRFAALLAYFPLNLFAKLARLLARVLNQVALFDLNSF
ncbi:MAG TPA: hypothetical protein QGH28_03685, partial [Chloroflexota bacterium]|nr:hypothetical protein [Chloroflexota bacterium]